MKEKAYVEQLQRWRLLTANEAYPILGYRTAKALRLAAQLGLAPRVTIGKTVRFDLDAIREWAAKGGTPLNGKTPNQEELATTA